MECVNLLRFVISIVIQVVGVPVYNPISHNIVSQCFFFGCWQCQKSSFFFKKKYYLLLGVTHTQFVKFWFNAFLVGNSAFYTPGVRRVPIVDANLARDPLLELSTHKLFCTELFAQTQVARRKYELLKNASSAEPVSNNSDDYDVAIEHAHKMFEQDTLRRQNNRYNRCKVAKRMFHSARKQFTQSPYSSAR